VAPNDDGRRARVEAWDVKTGGKLWDLTVFTNPIDPALEEDVQWDFIKSMRIADGRLVVTSEQGKTSRVDLKTRKVTAAPDSKIEFDLAQLDEDGLRGPDGGKVALSYEFKIPDTEQRKAQVRAIDPSVRFMPGSRGRVGAGGGECLCIGTTHQKNFRRVLRALADLPFSERIIECHFE
jgi:hypothetical protein